MFKRDVAESVLTKTGCVLCPGGGLDTFRVEVWRMGVSNLYTARPEGRKIEELELVAVMNETSGIQAEID